jgi:hypothetical protein
VTDEYYELQKFVKAWMHTPKALSVSAATRDLVWALFEIAAEGRRSVTINGNTMIVVVDSGMEYIERHTGRSEAAIKMRVRVAKKCGLIATQRQMGGCGLIVAELCIPVGCDRLMERYE